MESAIRAVKELHRYPLKGCRLVVDLSAKTIERLQTGKNIHSINFSLNKKWYMAIKLFFLN